MIEDLSSSSSKSETRITGSLCSSSGSSERNRSISSSSEWNKEVVSSLGAAAAREAHWKGNSSITTSFEAKNLGFVMSIQAKRRSVALIELPASWKVVDKGSKPRMSWTNLNCPSSLMKTSNLRTLLRSAMLTS